MSGVDEVGYVGALLPSEKGRRTKAQAAAAVAAEDEQSRFGKINGISNDVRGRRERGAAANGEPHASEVS